MPYDPYALAGEITDDLARAWDDLDWVTAAAGDTPISDADTGSGVDAALSIELSDVDTGSGADTESLLVVTLADADTGSGADTESLLVVTLADADTGTGADDGESIPGVYPPTVTPSTVTVGGGINTAQKSWFEVQRERKLREDDEIVLILASV